MTIELLPEHSLLPKSKSLRANTSGKKTRRRDIARTLIDLREHLFDELQALFDGESTPQEAVAFAEVSAKVLDTIEMEMKHVAFKQELESRKQRLLCAPQSHEEDEDVSHLS